MQLDDIVESLEFLEDWDERYRFLIELGRDLAPLSDEERVEENRVDGCVSQVWLVCEDDPTNKDQLRFRADSDAHITKGLVALLVVAYSGKTPEAIQAFDSRGLFERLDLAAHLSPLRSNGLVAMDRRIRALAAARAR